jgi:hypothetical protein
LTKTTINLKADNTDLEKINNDKMYRTLKNNNKDIKNVIILIINLSRQIKVPSRKTEKK